jgi:hypothetical protein
MDPHLIPIVGMLIPIIIVPTALGFKHARYLRQVEHEERMRAMELGQTLPGDQSWTPASIAMAIGAGVPIAAMFIAYIAAPKQGSSETLWMATGMIGVAGVLCGSLLASQWLIGQGKTQNSRLNEKPAFDPEAFESVANRR